jgi:hypothetical protein
VRERGPIVTGWIVRWRAVEERFASASDALDRWERLDALGREPELLEVPAEAAVPVAREAGGEEGVEAGGEPDAP